MAETPQVVYVQVKADTEPVKTLIREAVDAERDRVVAFIQERLSARADELADAIERGEHR